MNFKICTLALSALLSIPIASYAGTSSGVSPTTEKGSDDLFSYVITNPTEDSETFWSIKIQFPNASSVEFLPSFMDRPGYISYKKNGEVFNAGEYGFPSMDGNTIELNPDFMEAASVNDKWEVTLQPGLFALCDPDGNQLGTNPLMDIVVTGEEDDLFTYVITNPTAESETFWTIDLQFPKAASIEYLPSFMDRPGYISYKKNGEVYNAGEYAFPSMNGNTIQLDPGFMDAGNVNDRWEVTLQPGLFALCDADENQLGTNPLMEIVVTEGAGSSSVDFSYTSEPAADVLLSELIDAKVTFTNLDKVSASNAVVTLGNTVIEETAYTIASGVDNVVTVNFSPALTTTEDATLKITFPEGSLTGTQGAVTDTNPSAVEATYSLVPEAVYDLAIDFYQPKPDENGNLSVNKSLAMAIFICDTPDIKQAGGTENNITLKEVNGDFECSGKLMTLTGMVSGKSTFYASFNQPVYNGAYTVTIKRGAVGDARWRTDHTMGHSNDDIVLNFNIVDGEDRPSTPHIDLSEVYSAPETIAVKGVPSEDNIYWYANVIEPSRYPGDDEIVQAAIEFFQFGAETFGMDWITVYQMTAKTGEYTWVFGDLLASSDYIAYAFGLDENGNLYMPLTKINVRTQDMPTSDNTFTLDVLSVENGTEQETKKVTVKVTPTNDDQYAVVILDKYLADQYDLTEENSHKNYLRNVLRPLVTDERKYTGEQTVVFDNVKIDALMHAAVFGFEQYESTQATLAEFSTVDNDFEAVSVMAYDPTISGASATVYSFDMQRPFIMGVASRATVESIGGIQNIHEEYRIPQWEAAGMGYYDWRYFANHDLCRQPLDGTLNEIAGISSLKWNTDYFLYAYLMDEGGYRTSPVYYDEFTTKSCNQTNNKFELKLNSVNSNEPYSSNTYTAELSIIPSIKSEAYALYYGETYDFEQYLHEDRVDDWMYDVFMQRRVKRTYTGDLDFSYGSVYDDKNYILIVTGFDEAPNTAPAWILFNKDGIYQNSSSNVTSIIGNALRVYAIDRDIHVAGDFTEAAVYTTDGMKMGTIAEGTCSVSTPGIYIVRVVTANGIETRKIAVK